MNGNSWWKRLSLPQSRAPFVVLSHQVLLSELTVTMWPLKLTSTHTLPEQGWYNNRLMSSHVTSCVRKDSEAGRAYQQAISSKYITKAEQSCQMCCKISYLDSVIISCPEEALCLSLLSPLVLFPSFKGVWFRNLLHHWQEPIDFNRNCSAQDRMKSAKTQSQVSNSKRWQS